METKFTITPEDLVALHQYISLSALGMRQRTLGRPSLWAWAYAALIFGLLVFGARGNYWKAALDIWPLELSVLAVLLISVLRPTFTRRAVRRLILKLIAEKKHDYTLSLCRLRVTSACISMKYAKSKHTLCWSEVTAIDTTNHQRFFVAFGLADGLVVPRHAFSSEQAFKEFANFTKLMYAESAA